MTSRLLLWLYFVLSFSDYLCTVLLCHLTAGNVEGNPIASFFLHNCGVVGLGVYKLVCVGVFLLSLRLMGERGKRYVKPLLCFGCCLLLVIVGYSGFLLVTESR